MLGGQEYTVCTWRMFYQAHAKDVLNFVRGRWNVSFRRGCAVVVLN